MIIFISLWYICCILYRHGTFGTPTINPVGSIWCFCKKKLPPKAILLHFLYYLYEYSCMASLCMWVHLKSQVEEVVVVKSEYEQKISAIWLYLIASLSCEWKLYFVKYLVAKFSFSDINIYFKLWNIIKFRSGISLSFIFFKVLTSFD